MLKEPNYLSKIQISNLDPANQDEEKNPDEIFSNENNKIPFDNNSKLLLSKVLHNNQKPKIPIKHNVINNIDDNAYNNFLLNLSNIQNFSIYNSIIYNDINNYNNIINKMNHEDKLYINKYNNNFTFSLNQSLNEKKINLIQYNNKINNPKIIPNLNQINNSQMGININNFHNLSSENNINENIIIGQNAFNISNFNKNINYSNTININDNQINNNLNCLNLIHNNFIKNKLNTTNNSFKINNIHNNSTSPDSYDSLDEKSLSKENNLDKSYSEDFMKFIKNLSMPLLSFLCTPKGTLEIQKKLGKSNSECKVLLIKLLGKEGLTTIMKNTYGNYFFQQMIKSSETIIISLIISYISTEFIEISKDPSGTFSVQALLNEISSIKEEQEVLNSIKGHEIEMAYNKNATYVLQKIVLLFPDIHRIYLNEIILNNFKELCLDSNGICLIKNFIKTNTLVNNKKRINDEIKKNFVVLAESPFGNYGIQYIMDNWNKNELNDIKKKIFENIYKLAVQQFSSNVVEKGIEIFDEDSREKMIKKLCFEGNFIILLKNKFGRFVLNKAINYMKKNLKNEFENFLINNIHNNVYCHKDKNKVKKFLIKINNDNDYQNYYGIDLNKEFFVRKKIGNICTNNFILKNNQNNINGNKGYFS